MKILYALFVATLLFLLAGCYNYEEMLVINEDGSGTIDMKISIDKIGELGSFGGATDSMFSKQMIEDNLADNESGLKLISYSSTPTEETNIWNMRYSFTNINKLPYLYEAIMPEEKDTGYDDDSEPPLLYSKQDDGTWLFTRAFDDVAGPEDMMGTGEVEEEYYSDERAVDDSAPPAMPALDLSTMDSTFTGLAEKMKMMSEQMADDKLSFTIEFPGKILESNATKIEGNVATWEYSLEEMSEMPSEMRAVIKP